MATEGPHEAGLARARNRQGAHALGCQPSLVAGGRRIAHRCVGIVAHRDGAAARALCEADIDAYEAARAESRNDEPLCRSSIRRSPVSRSSSASN